MSASPFGDRPWKASYRWMRGQRDSVRRELDDANARIERAWELCQWESSTKDEIAATLLPEVSGE